MLQAQVAYAVPRSAVAALFTRRKAPVSQLGADADRLARTCLAIAARFRRGGRLITFGNGQAATDAAHVAAEFAHPVIVGKRALPALSLTGDVATLTGVAQRYGFADVFAYPLRHLAEPADIALGISTDGGCHNVLRGLQVASQQGLLTIAMVGGDGGAIATSPVVDQLLLAGSTDPRVVKEIQVTTYHLLWELVQMFLEQPVEQPTRERTGQPAVTAQPTEPVR